MKWGAPLVDMVSTFFEAWRSWGWFWPLVFIFYPWYYIILLFWEDSHDCSHVWGLGHIFILGVPPLCALSYDVWLDDSWFSRFLIVLACCFVFQPMVLHYYMILLEGIYYLLYLSCWLTTLIPWSIHTFSVPSSFRIYWALVHPIQLQL